MLDVFTNFLMILSTILSTTIAFLNGLASVPAVASLLGALVGSGFGFLSARWLEFRRERRQRAAIVWAVFVEMG